MGEVLALPSFAPPPPAARNDLLLSPDEVRDAAGGYRRPAEQLRELHARGFTRAYIPKVGTKRVVLERAHYDAVVRGHYGQQAAPAVAPVDQAPPRPNRARLQRHFEQKRKK